MSDANSIIQDNIRVPPKWIELNLTKKECSMFLAVPGSDETLCQCGRRKVEHGDFAKHQHRPEHWSPNHHTRAFSTDAYGTISFEGEHHPNKAHFVRLSYDTSPEVVLQLMRYVWGIKMPKLVISIRGGSVNFDLPPRIGRIFQNGLIKAAKTTSAWVFSGGFNAGVAKHLGIALNNERWVRGNRRDHIVSVGIAPWGLCEHRDDLIGRNTDTVYSPLEYSGSKFFHLNPRHSNFLLVDNGTIGKFGGENYLRRRLEKCISYYPISSNRGCGTPIVVIVLEGGFHTLRMITEYVYDDPPIPIVILAGTGRASDLVAWMLRKFVSEDELEDHKQDVIRRIISTFNLRITDECSFIFDELKDMFQKKHLITVYNPLSSTNEEEFDAIILASLFRSQHWSPLQQLSLTLVWDRVDIANREVFVYGREWSRDHLDHAMMEALVSNRLDFVSLLLEHGLNMQTFLTANRLEALYSLDHLPFKLLGAVLLEFAQVRLGSHKKKSSTELRKVDLTLYDIGIALSHMMGHIYRSNYVHMRTKLHDPNEPDSDETKPSTFPQPFDDLFIWAILTKRHELAKLLWLNGHRGALAKSLVAVKLNKYLAKELSKTMTTLVNELEKNAEEWESLSLSLLDSCYRQDSKMARQLLTMELEHWSQQTCLTLAVMANHRMLLGHPCCQILLADLWMGALNSKSHTSLKIILATLFPPLALFWDYKSKEELRLLPHQEKDVPYDIIHTHRDIEVEIEVAHSLQFENFDLEKKIPETQTIHTFVQGENQSLTNIFRNRYKGRKTDLADVVSKINFGTHSGKIGEEQVNPQEKRNYDNKMRVMSAMDFRNKPPPRNANYKLNSGAGGGKYPIIISKESNSLQSTTIAEAGTMPKNDTEYHKLGLRNPHLGQSSFVTTQHSLKLHEKFIEFQKAPITNFYRHTIAYLIFIVALAYVILYPQDRHSMGYVEMFVVSYVATLSVECIREFIFIDALSLSMRMAQMKNHTWTIGDFLATMFFLTGTFLRMTYSFNDGMLIYRVSSIYWNMRLYKYLGVHPFVGPKIVMMSRMFSHMAHFAMIIFVVIISFGVAREAIQFPDLNPTWADLAEAFLEPYVMMFGEVELSSLTPECVTDDCPMGSWLIPICWVVYMMVSNILIVNVLIAVFNGIYEEIDAQAVEVWMFQRFQFVMEFEQKPILPPPLIAICHLVSMIKFFFRRFIRCICEEAIVEKNITITDDERPHVITTTDQNLKSFLSPTEQHMIFDFEEENVDLIRHLLAKDQQGTASTMGTEAMLAYRIGVTTSVISERSAIQQLKNSLQDLYNDMEAQKTRLEKLVEMWEMEVSDDEEPENSDSATKSLASTLVGNSRSRLNNRGRYGLQKNNCGSGHYRK